MTEENKPTISIEEHDGDDIIIAHEDLIIIHSSTGRTVVYDPNRSTEMSEQIVLELPPGSKGMRVGIQLRDALMRMYTPPETTQPK